MDGATLTVNAGNWRSIFYGGYTKATTGSCTLVMNGGNVNTGGRINGTVLYSCNATREQYLGGWTPFYMNYNGVIERKPTKIDSNKAYYLRNVNSGLYLGTAGEVTDNANIVQTVKDNALVWVLSSIALTHDKYLDWHKRNLPHEE